MDLLLVQTEEFLAWQPANLIQGTKFNQEGNEQKTYPPNFQKEKLPKEMIKCHSHFVFNGEYQMFKSRPGCSKQGNITLG